MQGPPGTGKTETARDLARALARPHQVINVDETTNVLDSLLACAQSGTWLIMDEPTKLAEQALSELCTYLEIIHTA